MRQVSQCGPSLTRYSKTWLPATQRRAERRLQAGDVRAWAAAFGEMGTLAGPGESQVAAGIVTAILTALVGSALPGPGSSIRATSVQIKSASADRRSDDGAARRAREAAGSRDRRAGRPVHRPGGSGRCHGGSGSPGTHDTAADRVAGASARRTDRALPDAEADAHRRGASLQRRRAGRCGGSRRGRADPARSFRPRSRDPTNRGSSAPRPRQVPDRANRRPGGLRR